MPFFWDKVFDLIFNLLRPYLTAHFKVILTIKRNYSIKDQHIFLSHFIQLIEYFYFTILVSSPELSICYVGEEVALEPVYSKHFILPLSVFALITSIRVSRWVSEWVSGWMSERMCDLAGENFLSFATTGLVTQPHAWLQWKSRECVTISSGVAAVFMKHSSGYLRLGRDYSFRICR